MFTETLEIKLIDRNTKVDRFFTLEATPVQKYRIDEDGAQVPTKVAYASRVFENGVLLNPDDMPQFDRDDDAIQAGFEYAKGLVR